jgi:ribosomal protein S18 acetylase RimI-like enzyme
MPPPAITIAPLAGDAEARACACLIASSDPWLTLGRSEPACLRAIQDPTREVFMASRDGELAGFLILCLTGAFVGYIQTVCVAPAQRSQRLGTELIRFAEERIFRRFPNVFMWVSSFNTRAGALYQRLGYEVVGELRDYIVPGHAEWVLRKTAGPLQTFRPAEGS